MRLIFLTVDGNHTAALRAAAERLRREHGVGITLCMYDASSLRSDADWKRLAADVAAADFIFGARLFGEELIRPLERLLKHAAAPVCIITSNPALIQATHLGLFDLRKGDAEQEPGVIQQWIKKLRPQGGSGEAKRQLAVLRNLTKVLKLIPGKARDIYTYAVAHQYWLNCAPENLYRMLCLIIERYVPGHTGKLPMLDPISYPELALWHPAAAEPFATQAEYDAWRSKSDKVTRRQADKVSASSRRRGEEANSPAHPVTQSSGHPGSSPIGTVGILSLRTVALTGNSAHLAALIEALERRGIEPRLAYASGLDQRPAIEAFFAGAAPAPKGLARLLPFKQATPAPEQHAAVDLLVNATGFALVGGPAESKPAEARAALAKLDVGYLNLVPLAFQRIEEWRADDTGLAPIQSALSVAVPELDGASDPIIYGGPTSGGDSFAPLPAEIEQAAERIARRVTLRRKANAEKRLAIVIFNFPPNLGNIGTAAYLDVFASMYALLVALRADGYDVELPASAAALRTMIIEGNAVLSGTDGNVSDRFPVEQYRQLFPDYAAIEPFWGRAPGELLNDGKQFQILGRRLGKLFIGIQPSFGYERDPMRLLMAKDAAPNHAFAAFYTWLRHVYQADAVLHFGTHGALEFMPGKQVGLSANCWPYRLLGELPNFYYYSVNNPSEAAIAKRRGMATLVSYLVPPLQQAGLYKGLRALKDSIDRYRAAPSDELVEDIRLQAEKLGMQTGAEPTVDDGRWTVPEATVDDGRWTVAEPTVDDGRWTVAEPTVENQASSSAAPSTVHGRPSAASSAAPSTVHGLPSDAYIAAVSYELLQVEERMIPAGLHVIGRPPAPAELVDFLALTASFRPARKQDGASFPAIVAAALGYDYAALRDRLAGDLSAQEQWQQVERICRKAIGHFVDGGRWTADGAELLGANGRPGTANGAALLSAPPGTVHRLSSTVDSAAADAYLAQTAAIPVGALDELWAFLGELLTNLVANRELEGLLHGLRGGFIPPSPSNDVVRDPGVVPTGRNVYSLDPYRVPSPVAVERARTLVSELLTSLTAQQGRLPETVAVVLWGSDNLKSDCEGVAQVLWMLGARPLLDELGSVSDVALIPLAELGRPRVDVVVTVSGVFRDLLGHQMQLVDRAARLAACADEPLEQNFIRKHALDQAATLGISLEEAASRVFANAPGSYGANVNYLVESSTWEDDSQLNEAFLSRRSFSIGKNGQWGEARALMEQVLGTVDASFQNVDSFEVGISDIDYYYESLGGVTKAVESIRGKRPPVVVADAVSTTNRLSSLEQAVRLESRAKLLNPKWYEAMLAHGYEGAREIEIRVNNTYGWSATAGAVEGWVYQGVAETFVLDEAMRERLATLNPTAAVGVVRRLLEASGRGFWDADPATLDQLREIYADLEDRLEGVAVGG